MSPRLLGILGMLGAPFLMIDFLVHPTGSLYPSTALSGFFSFVYISGWMCSIIGLGRLKATGTSPWGKVVLSLQILFLSLANVPNVVSILDPVPDSRFFLKLDIFWPISHVFMLATAAAVLKAGRWKGWTRYAPLMVALWLPLSLAVQKGVWGAPVYQGMAGGVFSAIACTLLGYTVYYYSEKPLFSKPYFTFNAYAVE